MSVPFAVVAAMMASNPMPRTLTLDFTETETLDSRITFERANAVATRVNASGLIETVGSNVARFDHDPVSLVPRGLLIEEGRTNLLLRSAEFDNAAWNKSSCSVSANAAVSPDGGTNADQLTSSGANGFAYQTFAATAGVAYTFSLWVKSVASGVTLSLQLYNSGGSSVIAATSFTTTGAWQRVTVSGTSATTQTAWAVIGGNASFSSGETLYIWGAQLEAGNFATSYIPTAASSVTRSADSAVMTGSNFSGWFNQSEGTFVVTFQGGRETTQGGYGRALGYDGGRCFVSRNNGNALVWWNNSNSLVRASLPVDPVNGVTTAVAAWDASGRILLSQGLSSSDSYGLGTTATLLDIGKRSPGTLNSLNGHVRKIHFYRKRLALDVLEALAAA